MYEERNISRIQHTKKIKHEFYYDLRNKNTFH